jgi:hypothetical protein
MSENPKPYSHLHRIWQADHDACRADMISRVKDPDAKPPGKFTKPYALQGGNRFRLPIYRMVDKHFRCWWWDAQNKFWEFKFRIMIGTPALDDEDYIIDEPIGFDGDSQSVVYHKDAALELIAKGITHFIPHTPDCPPLLFCDPLDFDKIIKEHERKEYRKNFIRK